MKPDEREVRRVEEIAASVAELARRILGPDLDVRWFGSWPEGRAAPRSDIDVAVFGAEEIPLIRMGELRQAIEDLPTLYSIDVVDLAQVDAAFRQHVIETGRRL